MVVVEWLFVRKTGADELDKQLRVEENDDCSWRDNLRHCDNLNV